MSLFARLSIRGGLADHAGEACNQVYCSHQICRGVLPTLESSLASPAPSPAPSPAENADIDPNCASCDFEAGKTWCWDVMGSFSCKPQGVTQVCTKKGGVSVPAVTQRSDCPSASTTDNHNHTSGSSATACKDDDVGLASAVASDPRSKSYASFLTKCRGNGQFGDVNSLNFLGNTLNLCTYSQAAPVIKLYCKETCGECDDGHAGLDPIGGSGRSPSPSSDTSGCKHPDCGHAGETPSPADQGPLSCTTNQECVSLCQAEHSRSGLADHAGEACNQAVCIDHVCRGGLVSPDESDGDQTNTQFC